MKMLLFKMIRLFFLELIFCFSFFLSGITKLSRDSEWIDTAKLSSLLVSCSYIYRTGILGFGVVWTILDLWALLLCFGISLVRLTVYDLVIDLVLNPFLALVFVLVFLVVLYRVFLLVSYLDISQRTCFSKW